MDKITDSEGRHYIDQLFRFIMTATKEASESDQVARGLFHLLFRCVLTRQSINLLADTLNDQAENDCCALLRCIWDAHIQAAYMVSDPSKSDERAQAYFDFVWVERREMHRFVFSHDTDISRDLAKSPDRTVGEPNLEAQFQRVLPRFKLKNGRPRHHWYPGTLRDLAKALGNEAEFDTLYWHLHSSVHSSTRVVKNGPSISAEHVGDWASIIAARIADLVVSRLRINLPEEAAALLQTLAKTDFCGKRD
jgi:hypothetical protein